MKTNAWWCPYHILWEYSLWMRLWPSPLDAKWKTMPDDAHIIWCGKLTSGSHDNHYSWNHTKKWCRFIPISCIATIYCPDSVATANRVPHGYTAGRVFPHRTRTRQNRYPWRVTPVTTRYFRGIIRNPWCLWYPRFLFIKTLYIHLNITLKKIWHKEGKEKAGEGA